MCRMDIPRVWTVVAASGHIAQSDTLARAKATAKTISKSEQTRVAVYDFVHRPVACYNKGYFWAKALWKHDPRRLLPRVDDPAGMVV